MLLAPGKRWPRSVAFCRMRACRPPESTGHWQPGVASTPAGIENEGSHGTGDDPASVATRKRVPGHPLETLPFFRRIKPFRGRAIVYTLITGTPCSLPCSRPSGFVRSRCASATVLWSTWSSPAASGSSSISGFALGRRLLGGSLRLRVRARLLRIRVRSWSSPAMRWALPCSTGRSSDEVFSPPGTAAILLLSLIVSATMATIFAREAAGQGRRLRERARVEAAEKQIRVAQLSSSRRRSSRIFVHTLANVISLIDAEPATAKHDRALDRLSAPRHL
jgi:hypothetical protein